MAVLHKKKKISTVESNPESICVVRQQLQRRPDRMRKTAANCREGRKSRARNSKSLTHYFKQRKSRDLQEGKQEEEEGIGQSGDENKGKQGKGFFACYLLTSLSPRHKGHTYIGFTVNPRRRIRQHNGEIGSGAWRTKRKRPWEMVICIYGFPTNISALQFEWAWQHPRESVAVREAAATFKSFSGVTNKIKLAYTMLTLPAWQSLKITVNYFSTKYTHHSASCPSLPEQMKVQICSMDELPCYTEKDDLGDDYDNVDDDDDEVDYTCETVNERYSDELVNVSANNLHSRIHEAFHGQVEDNEEYIRREPGDSFISGPNTIHSHILTDSATTKAFSITTGSPMVEAAECEDTSIIRKQSLRKRQFAYDVEAVEDPQSCVREKPLNSFKGCESRGESSTFGAYHTLPFIYLPVQKSPWNDSSLSNGQTVEGANVSIIEKECPSQKQFTAAVAATGDQQQRKKPLTTEVVFIEDQLRPTVDCDVEVINLITPSPVCRVRSCKKKRRISASSPEIIDLT